MPRIGVAVILVIFSAICITCGGGGSPTSPNDSGTDPKAFTVTGSILTSADAGIPDVSVTLSGNSVNMTTTSNADGKYTFSDIASGSYSITPQKNGYVFTPASIQASVSGSDVTVSAVIGAQSGGTIDEKDIQGRIVDATGKGIEFVRVSLEKDGDSEFYRIITTNENGEYSFESIGSGTFTVKPLSPLFGDMTFSPASITVTFSGTPLTITDIVGSETATEPTYAVSGKVLDATGTGIASAELRIYLLGEDDLISVELSDSQGNYRFSGLSAGTYEIYVYKENVGFTKEKLTITISGADAVAEEFTVSGGGTTTHPVSGRIADAQGNGASGVTVYLVPFTEDGQGSSTIARTDNNGFYFFSGISAGVYKIQPLPSGADVSPAAYLQYYNGSQAIGGDFALIADNTAQSLTVSGTIRDQNNNPINTGSVKLMFHGIRISEGFLNDSGQYVIRDVFDAAYEALPSLQNYSALPASRNVTVSGSSVSGIDFTATSTLPTFTFSGRLIDSFGDPLVGATITVKDQQNKTYTLTTDAKGKYSLSGLTDQEYILTPAMNNFTFGVFSRTVKFNGADKTVVDWAGVSLQYNASRTGIIGYVKDKTGTGVSGVTVTLTDVLGYKKTNVTTTEGSYYFDNLVIGQYTITVAKDDLTFTPSVQTIRTENELLNEAPDFIANIESLAGKDIQGKVVDATGKGIEFIRVSLEKDGDSEFYRIITTNENGEYSFENIGSGTFTVKPLSPLFEDWLFSPESQRVTFAGTPLTLPDFAASPKPEEQKYEISGLVLTSTGVGISGAEVSIFKSDESGMLQGIITDSTGSFVFDNLDNGTYTIYVYMEGKTFVSTEVAITVNGSDVTAPSFVEVAKLSD